MPAGAARTAIEADTNRRAGVPYAALNPDQRLTLPAGLGALAEQIAASAIRTVCRASINTYCGPDLPEGLPRGRPLIEAPNHPGHASAARALPTTNTGKAVRAQRGPSAGRRQTRCHAAAGAHGGRYGGA